MGSSGIFIVKVFAALLGIITSIVIVRNYGESILGIMAIINSLLLVLAVFSSFGSNTAILKFIPQYKKKYSIFSAYSIYKKLLYIIIITSIVIGSILFSMSSYFESNYFLNDNYLFLLVSMMVVFSAIYKFNLNSLRGLKNVKSFALIQFLYPLSLLIFIIIATFLTEFNIYNPIYIRFFLTILFSIIGLYLVNKIFKKQISTEKNISIKSQDTGNVKKELVQVCFPLFLTSIMLIVIGRIGVICLGIYVEPSDVAYYSVAFRLGSIITFVISAIEQIIAPKFSELYASSKVDRMFLLAKKTTKLMLFVTLPFFLGFYFLGEIFFTKLYGENFIVSYHLLLIISLGFFLNAIFGNNAYLLSMCGYQNKVKNTMIVTLIFNLILNFTLIPNYGVFGAAISLGLTQIIRNILLTYFIKLEFNKTIMYIPFNK